MFFRAWRAAAGCLAAPGFRGGGPFGGVGGGPSDGGAGRADCGAGERAGSPVPRNRTTSNPGFPLNGDRPTILLVDDSRDTLEPLKRLLTLCGYDVRTATTAEQAMALAADPRPAALTANPVSDRKFEI